MSRPTVIRRLTAVFALLAVLCLALPAAAAPGARGHAHQTRAVHAASLVDQFLAWIGSFWTGPSQGRADRTEKAGPAIQLPLDGTNNSIVPPDTKTEHSGMIDPNG